MRLSIHYETLIIAVGLLLAIQAGCNSKSRGTVEIQGQVMLDGQPVQSGTISFNPDSGMVGPTSGAEIRDGHYKVSAGQVSSPREGLHRVEITVFPALSKEEEERIQHRPINAPADAGELTNSPRKFQDPSLVIDLHSGVNTYNVELNSSR